MIPNTIFLNEYYSTNLSIDRLKQLSQSSVPLVSFRYPLSAHYGTIWGKNYPEILLKLRSYGYW